MGCRLCSFSAAFVFPSRSLSRTCSIVPHCCASRFVYLFSILRHPPSPSKQRKENFFLLCPARGLALPAESSLGFIPMVTQFFGNLATSHRESNVSKCYETRNLCGPLNFLPASVSFKNITRGKQSITLLLLLPPLCLFCRAFFPACTSLKWHICRALHNGTRENKSVSA